MSLKVENIVKTYGNYKAVDGLSFEMNEPGVFALLGTNGAGKTTSIRIILGMLSADSGSVTWHGKPFCTANESIGYLAEERGLYPKYKIMDQLLYFASLKGMRRQDAQRSIDYWFERLGIEEHRDKRAEQLSKGNQQKVQLAATLVGEPQLVILDEPFSGLDPVNAQVLKDVIRELIRDGRIVIFSSHQMSYVEEFCEDIAIINHGDVVLAGHLDDIKDTYGRGRKTISADNYSPQELADICREKLSSYAAVERVTKKYVVLEMKPQADMWQILDICKQAGVELHQFGAYEPSLNDIFISCVGDEELDAEAAKEAV